MLSLGKYKLKLFVKKVSIFVFVSQSPHSTAHPVPWKIIATPTLAPTKRRAFMEINITFISIVRVDAELAAGILVGLQRRGIPAGLL